MMVNRRKFLGSIMAAGAVGLLAPRVSQAAESRVEILINEPIGKILPDILQPLHRTPRRCHLRRYLGRRKVESA